MLLQVEPQEILTLNEILKLKKEDWDAAPSFRTTTNSYAVVILQTRQILGLPITEKDAVLPE